MSKFVLISFTVLLFPLPAHAEPTTVIHILNWHYVSPDVFATDLKEQDSTLTQEQIDQQYHEFLGSVEAIQKQQMKLLRRLIKKHKLKAVYIEGLTEKNHKDVMKSIESIKEYEKTKDDPPDVILEFLTGQDKLVIGAAGRLVVKGELKTLLPAEDAKAFEAADPVRADGTVVFDKKADEAREDAIVRNLLKADGVVVITLGGAHDLSDNLKRLAKGCKYERVAVPKHRGVAQ
ncbi:hypothetical protein [Gimesia fumaroli]|uniref:Uncharacterized protein n=1 Tax=Gimesia fumaroli TaxID=2527976 RepID=A0A518IKR5_9PLAN|nr:hypothetical protein [Gimesia fumaroli]QDV53686.1 hypothetical protein Enr17x_57670 [Gimesia fumaroli]